MTARTTRCPLLAVTAMLVGAAPACSGDPEARVDALFEDYAGNDMPGAAVRVIRDGEPVLTRAFGMADLDRGRPVTAASNFRLASITKQFTAMSILMLVEDGRLTLDTPLPTLFPELPRYADRITIRHLLQHQSGLPDYEPMVPADTAEQVRDADVLDLMLQVDETDFEPGSAYRYSNTGYAVLAMAVEKLSGITFAEFLEERIFAPAGMQGTVAFEDGTSTVPERAYGYTVTEEAVEFSDQSAYSAVLGDGGIYSSLQDLTYWDRALSSDDLITADSKAAMFEPALEGYGFGWRIDTYAGRRRYHHSGSTSGFRNFIQRFPDERLTIIVLTNRAEPDVEPLAEKVADLYL